VIGSNHPKTTAEDDGQPPQPDGVRDPSRQGMNLCQGMSLGMP